MTTTQPDPSRDQNRRGLWTLAIIFGGLFLLFFAFATLVLGAVGPQDPGKNRIGVLNITGAITSADDLIRDLDAFVRDDEIKGILVRIESPGGAVGASQELHEAVKRAAAKKKLVISMGNIAASGGFYIACAAKPVFASPGTITGSIGVINQTFDVHAITDDLGLKLNVMKSGESKDAGNPFREMTDHDRALYQSLVDSIYAQFLQAVADGRGLPLADLKGSPLTDGRVFSGADAYEAKLVDHLGGLQAAVDHLSEALDFKGPPTLIYPSNPRMSWLRDLVAEGAASVRAEVSQAVTPAFELRYVGPFAP
jgi:protease-4